MRRIILVVLGVIFLQIGLVAGFETEIEGPGGSANVTPSEPQLRGFMTSYPMADGYAMRNYQYPEYEYAFEGDILGFWVEADEQNVNEIENLEVNVTVDCPCPGGRCVTMVPLTFISSTGAVYDEDTGRYVGQFSGDFEIPTADEMRGNCNLGVMMVDVAGVSVEDSLDDPLYENVDDILANPSIDFYIDNGLEFLLNINQWNLNLHYPVNVALNTNDDTEGQGVVGNISMRATALVGLNYPDDIIYPDDIRFMRSNDTVWTNLAHDENEWTMLQEEMNTNGGAGYNEQLFFEIWYDASHWDLEYSGAVMYFYISVF